MNLPRELWPLSNEVGTRPNECGDVAHFSGELLLIEGKPSLRFSRNHEVGWWRARTDEESFAFDALGGLVAAGRKDASVSFERDPVGRIVREHHTLGGVTRTVENRYDPTGLRR